MSTSPELDIDADLGPCVTAEESAGMQEERLGVVGGFRITISRQKVEEELGLELEVNGDGKSFRISSIYPNKLIAKWNATATRDLQVKEGDCIMEVNGKQRKQGVHYEIMNALQISALCVRAEEYKVSLTHRGPLGFHFQPSNSENCSSLIITKIDAKSPVAEWNRAHQDQPQLIIAVHDRVVEVNGKRGSSHELFDGIKSAEKREIILSRCPRHVLVSKFSDSTQPSVGDSMNTVRRGRHNAWCC